jgi:hypothetical protein
MKELWLALLCSTLLLGQFNSSVAARSNPSSASQLHLDDADPNATRDLIEHNIGNVRTSVSNYGEFGNPNRLTGFVGLKYPRDSFNDLLFSAGIWVGASVNGIPLVSTTTDGDNGTGEFWPVHIGSIPATNTDDPDWYISSSSLVGFGGDTYVHGALGEDDDHDWILATDDLDSNLLPSGNWDGGCGRLFFDDDDDGLIDEEIADGIDNDGDGATDEDTDVHSDAFGDGDCSYDPEPHIDEDPPGDKSSDHLDNDHDGLVDMEDPDIDGDCCPGSLDDDGDGQEDEDAATVGEQEYFCVFQDSIQPPFVSSPDIDGHTPLNIEVTQRSFAWSHPLMETVIILEYTVRNMGANVLDDVNLAFFADADILDVTDPDGDSMDDGTYFDHDRLMMVTFDDYNDDDGPAPGVVAVKAMRPPTCQEFGEFTYKNFDRLNGGDPGGNADKFLMMSSGEIDPPSEYLGDWRMLMGWGSLDCSLQMEPGDIISFSFALFAASDTNEANDIADRLSGDVSYLESKSTPQIASAFQLHQNYPNPFNSVSNIRFDLAHSDYLKLTVFDITGREVAVLKNGSHPAGTYSVNFDATTLSSGVYFYRLSTPQFSDTKKMILIK